MDYGLVIFALTGALVSIPFAQTRQYIFVSTPLNWTDAQSICRRDYTDLATIESTVDIADVSNTTSNYTGKAWIGLYDDLENSWRWSFNDSSFYGPGEETYRNWHAVEPNNARGQQYCVELFSTSPFFGLWGDNECSVTRPFVCYNGTVNGTASFVLVETLLNWTDAQTFCRANYVDLASIRNSTENAAVTSTARGYFVWIGLYRQKVWSDGSNSLFRHWADKQPDSGRELCVAAQFNNSGRWSDEDCSLSFPFICFTTGPPNAEGFRTTGQLETSIALQWNKVNDNVSFILQFNGSETNISAPAGHGPVTHVVSSLTAGTFYTFTLFSVIENDRSSGVSITAATYPPTTDRFILIGETETSITLQWNKVNNDVDFILQFNGSETNFSAPIGDGPIIHRVNFLAAATRYTFTLFSVIANIRGTGLQLSAATVPPIPLFRSTGQNETSITLQWNQVNNNVSFILQFNGSETNFSAAAGDGPINHTISSLSPATFYFFVLFSVFENVRSGGFGTFAFTAPSNANGFRSAGQNEISITLEWNQVNNVDYILQFNGSETNFFLAARDGPINHTVSSLTAGTKYTFTLFSVFVNVRSSGVNITAVTAPQNAASFRSIEQNETSITLQWNQVNNNVTFVLQFNGSETNISAPAGHGPVTHVVSSLTAGTFYTFTLFSVFENIRSSGVSITATTYPPTTDRFISIGETETSITLQWNKVNNDVGFILQFNGSETNFIAGAGDGPIIHTVSSLSPAISYLFTLFSVIANIRGTGLQLSAATEPPNTDSLRSTGQNETSITLQWNPVNNNVSFVLQFNGSESNFSATSGDGPINHTVSSLTAGTKYTFTLFSVFENIRSSGVNITAVTAPSNAESFRSTGQNETSITLQWNQVNNNVSFILQFNGSETNFSAAAGDGPINHTVSSLTAGTKYTFTLFSVFENIRSSGVNITAVTVPSNANGFTSTGQNETSITLQWNQVNNNVSFILQFNGSETHFSAAAGDGPISHTVSSLSPASTYTFVLFSVFENVRSSGFGIVAFTAPQNPDGFRSTGQNGTSINLQWNQVKSNVSFVLQFNGTAIDVPEPAGVGPVNYTVSSLTAGSKYTFTLFSVFENIRSSGINITAVTEPPLTSSFRSTGQNETSITLQWNQVNNNVNFVLQFNGSEQNFSAAAKDGPINHTVSSLTAGSKYTFTLFSVFENIRSSGINIQAVTAPSNAEAFRSTGQNETSITLQWNPVNNVTFVLQFNGSETNISAAAGDGLINHTVSSLTAGTFYTFTLFSVFENIRSSGVSITAATYPPSTDRFISIGETETSITLQWNKVNNDVGFILQFNGSETNFSAPIGDGPINHRVNFLAAATRYTFTLFSVIANIRGTGLQLSAATAPPITDSFRSTGQNETSITLQWNQVNNNVTFILQFNGSETNFSAAAGDGPINHTVSSLSPATTYLFILFPVFENVRSSGFGIFAFTAPQNPDGFRSTGQNGTSINLQWNQVKSNVSFVLQFNGTAIDVPEPAGVGPVNYTVSSLTAGSKYTFTLFSVFENIRSSGINITAVTAPSNANGFTSTGQNETSITLQWNLVNNNVTFVLQFNGSEQNFSAAAGDGPINHTVSSLTAGTKYTFILFSVFENIRSSGINITAVTEPPLTTSFRSTGQSETSITLQWNPVNNNVSFVLQFNGSETNFSAAAGDGPINHTISSLTAGTKYTFTLFSVFENIRSSGVNITAVTDPPNTDSFRSTGQNETSITLQWNQVNDNVSFILQFNGSETHFSAAAGDGPINHTVSSLSPATHYFFILFSVFENVRSSGFGLNAFTAPSNANGFRSTGQNEISITLQWNQVNNISYILQFNGSETNFSAAAGDGPISHTVSSLTAGTKYTFTLFSVFENIRSSGVNITAVTAPSNANGFIPRGQNETSITLQWNKVNNNVSFVLQFNGSETNISAPAGDGPISHTVSSLSPATHYFFVLFSVFENVRSSGVGINALTAPSIANGFRSTGQNETSITLQWNQESNADYILQFDGLSIYFIAAAADGPVNHTISSLTAGTKYTFTLFSVFGVFISSGVNITAVTAPQNAEGFRSIEQNETSITLQWNPVNNNVSFVLQFNGSETNFSAAAGDEPINHTVSSLTAGTKYTFTLFSVFENIRSSGVNITAVTGPLYILGLNIKLKSSNPLSESDMENVLAELFRRYGLLPELSSLRIRSVEP